MDFTDEHTIQVSNRMSYGSKTRHAKHTVVETWEPWRDKAPEVIANSDEEQLAATRCIIRQTIIHGGQDNSAVYEHLGLV